MPFYSSIILFFFTCCFLLGATETVSPKEKAFEEFFRQSVHGPAAYRAKLYQDAYFVRCLEALNGPTFDKAKALSELQRLKREVSAGNAWRIPPLKTDIPVLSRPPVIDGNIEKGEWKESLFFNKEYPLNEEKNLSECGSFWYIGYDREYLYFAARILGAEFRPGPVDKPFDGDAVEIFLHPDKRLSDYLETVVSCNGLCYQARAAQTEKRHFDLALVKKVSASAVVKTHVWGYCVEGKIPFSVLPGYLLGNQPHPGESMNFMLVCCRKDRQGKYTRTTPYPFLYDGHNIYGYIQGLLGQP